MILIRSRNADGGIADHQFEDAKAMFAAWCSHESPMGNSEVLLVLEDGLVLYSSLGQKARRNEDVLWTADVMDWYIGAAKPKGKKLRPPCIGVLSGREIHDGDFYLEDVDTTVDWVPFDEDGEDDPHWSYQLMAINNVDEMFGTNVETSENADYIDIYVSVSPDLRQIYDNHLEVILCKEDGTDEYYRRPLNPAEEDVMLSLVQSFEAMRLQEEVEKRRGKK